MDSDVILYGIRNCSTVKKSMQWLDMHGVSYQFHDFKESGLDKKTLTSWIRAVGWEKLVNRLSMTFRKLSKDDKNILDENKAVSLMLAYPTLIRRPILTGRGVQVGFKPDMYETVFVLRSEDN